MQSEFRDAGRSEQLSKQLSGPELDRFGNWQNAGFDDSELRYSPFQKARLAEIGSLTTILLPDDVQTIPLSVVVLILVLFLIVIVPVDYFALGHFNCRRFTWVVLPVVSLMFTGFTTWLGNAYLGATDYRTSLEFVDLTVDNRVIRNSRFEMLFSATQREVPTELKQTLYAAVSVTRRADAGQWNAGAGRRPSGNTEEPADRTDQPRDPDTPLYQGNIPALFTVRQQVRKWSPHVSRQTAFQTERPIPPFELDDIGKAWQQSSELFDSPILQQSLREKIQTVLPESTVLLFAQNGILDLTQREDARGLNGEPGVADTKHLQLVKLVPKVCVRPAVGLFSIVSQISPNGAGDFEDLAILDPDDEGQLLLVIVTRQGHDFVVYRRLFHKGS